MRPGATSGARACPVGIWHPRTWRCVGRASPRRRGWRRLGGGCGWAGREPVREVDAAGVVRWHVRSAGELPGCPCRVCGCRRWLSWLPPGDRPLDGATVHLTRYGPRSTAGTGAEPDRAYEPVVDHADCERAAACLPLRFERLVVVLARHLPPRDAQGGIRRPSVVIRWLERHEPVGWGRIRAQAFADSDGAAHDPAGQCPGDPASPRQWRRCGACGRLDRAAWDGLLDGIARQMAQTIGAGAAPVLTDVDPGLPPVAVPAMPPEEGAR